MNSAGILGKRPRGLEGTALIAYLAVVNSGKTLSFGRSQWQVADEGAQVSMAHFGYDQVRHLSQVVPSLAEADSRRAYFRGLSFRRTLSSSFHRPRKPTFQVSPQAASQYVIITTNLIPM